MTNIPYIMAGMPVVWMNGMSMVLNQFYPVGKMIFPERIICSLSPGGVYGRNGFLMTRPSPFTIDISSLTY